MKKLIFDGAFGTYYRDLGGAAEPCESANIKDSATVRKIHQGYLAAGANAIKTNTFGANRATFGDELITVIKQGFELASEAAAPFSARVFADIGPIGGEYDEASEDYLNVARLFVSCGAKDFLFETQNEIEPLVPAIKFINGMVKDACVAVCFAVSQDGYTKTGKYYKDLIDAAFNSGAKLSGLNCVCGPVHMSALIKKLDLSKGNILAMPNSGYPSVENGRTFYRNNAEYYSDKLAEMYSFGAIVGGCCGTTPEHIRQAVKKIKSLSAVAAPATVSDEGANVVNRHAFDFNNIIAVEIDPPADTETTYFIAAAQAASSAGANLITIADSPLARARADSFMLAAKLKRETGIDVLPHLSCRDRNNIAIKGALIGAYIEGIDKLLAVTGDSVAKTDRNDSKAVFNLNSFELISYINSMNEEVFYQRPFCVCAALNTSSPNFSAELKRAEKKAEQGARAFLTQPLFSAQSIENYRQAKKALQVPVLAGLMPIAGYRNALFLNNEVSGIDIPEEVISALSQAKPEQVKDISVDFCRKIIDSIKEECDGYYLMTPLKKIDFVCEIIRYIKGEVK